MTLTYRMHTKDDEEALRQLWNAETGWGEITPEEWRNWYINTPAGEAPIAVAEDQETGEIVGQFVFMPVRVSVNGLEITALRPYSPIVAKALAAKQRISTPLEHPVAAMYLRATQSLRERGVGLVYMIPNPRWLRFFQMFPELECGSFPLYSLPLPMAASLPMGADITVRTLTTWEARIDTLFQQAARLHRCMVVRNSRTLPWKLGGPGYIVQLVERNGEMIGLAASRPKGDRQWLICDLLTADSGDSVRATLTATVNLAHEKALAASAEEPILKAAVLTTPFLQPFASELGFVQDKYDFPMVVHVLDPSICKDDVAPSHWYVSAND